MAFSVALPTADWLKADWLSPNGDKFTVCTCFPSGESGSVEPGIYSPVAVLAIRTCTPTLVMQVSCLLVRPMRSTGEQAAKSKTSA